MSRNLSHLSGRKGLTKNMFAELGLASSETGSPGLESLEKIREEFLVGKSTVYGTESFYDFLRPENEGKKVYVCNGSACLTAGTQNDVQRQISNHFAPHEIGEMCCLGRCHENSAFQVNGKNYSGHDIDEIEKIKQGLFKTAGNLNSTCKGIPILTDAYGPIQEFYQIFTTCLGKSTAELLSQLRESGLRGRGGAGFSLAYKLEALRNEKSDQKFIVCNADEGDPGAYTDRFILENRPHALLMGMLIAAFIAGASRGVIYIRREYPESVLSINDCLDALRKEHLLGGNIQGSGFHFDITVITAQGAYICGEETALLSSIEGQRPEVRVRPPYPTQQGLFNQPTIVSNVETLANLPFIFKNGGRTFGSIGTQKSPGTKLLSLDGNFRTPGVCEVEMGTPLPVVVNEMGGGFRKPVKALHIGGPLGGLVPLSKIDDLTVDFESFASAGFLLGHASIVCIPEDFPLIKYLEHLFRFTAHESCGKCVPCRLGSIRGLELIKKAQDAAYRINIHLMNDLLETMETGSLCALGGGLPLPIHNAMKYFKDELSAFFSE
jgi:NADH-quinone oxidoreductase subunit F